MCTKLCENIGKCYVKEHNCIITYLYDVSNSLKKCCRVTKDQKRPHAIKTIVFSAFSRFICYFTFDRKVFFRYKTSVRKNENEAHEFEIISLFMNNQRIENNFSQSNVRINCYKLRTPPCSSVLFSTL